MAERDPSAAQAQAEATAQPVNMPARGIALELAFGLTDKQGTNWNGSMAHWPTLFGLYNKSVYGYYINMSQ